jgi:hypothetical protein
MTVQEAIKALEKIVKTNPEFNLSLLFIDCPKCGEVTLIRQFKVDVVVTTK